MIYKEEKRDLFSVPDNYYLAHCISADFALGKGIAVEFNKRFDMRNKLKSKYPDYLRFFCEDFDYDGDCIIESKTLNLITKRRYYQKPTYNSLRDSLEWMKIVCKNNNIHKVAMPKIGCGLDRLEWDKVSEIIKDVFKYTNIEILVCTRD